MQEQELRELICRVGYKMGMTGLTHGTNGNISARLDDRYILVTPTKSDLWDMKPEEIVKSDMDGNIIGEGKPTTELFMHIAAYKARPDVNGCVHAHAPYSTAYAVAHIPLEKKLLPEIVANLGTIPVLDYRPFHSRELAEQIGEALRDHDSVLMGNHGSMTVGNTLQRALYMTENTEFMCQIDVLTRFLGKAVEIEL